MLVDVSGKTVQEIPRKVARLVGDKKVKRVVMKAEHPLCSVPVIGYYLTDNVRDNIDQFKIGTCHVEITGYTGIKPFLLYSTQEYIHILTLLFGKRIHKI